MGDYGKYAYNNYTLLNTSLDSEKFVSTSFHEFTHMILTSQSCIGMMIYCFEKIKIPYVCKEDRSRYDAITEFLNRYTNIVQEGLAVFTQCVMKLMAEGKEECTKFIDDLRINNPCYYKYINPLLFIIEMMKQEISKEEILKTANIVFLLGIECMNGELYREDPINFISSKSIQKIISRNDFSKKYLPDGRFKKILKYCRKNYSTCQEIQAYILSILEADILEPSISKRKKHLRCIKEFIIKFFSDSDNVSIYKNRLSEISVTEINMKELYLQQLPTIFNEDEIIKCSRKANFIDLQNAVCEKYSIIMLYGSLEELLLYLNKKTGIIGKVGYDEKKHAENELVMHFDLKKKEGLVVIESIKQIDGLLLSEEMKSVVVTSYKNYDFSSNFINSHDKIHDEIFIYCDRTYHNAKCYFDKWKNQKIYYQYMIYNNMVVLIVRITEKRYFLLPMTSIVAIEADEDIRCNRKNMQMCNDEDEDGYDQYIITDQVMRDKIDIVVNCLFLLTPGNAS